jgi:serine/threonine-protein kinase RsbW
MRTQALEAEEWPMEKMLDRLELDSSLSELSRVWPWAEALAENHGLAQDTRFAMQLCMEEALANVVIHGYKNEPGHPIAIQASASDGYLLFAIEDEAPPFAPPEPGESKPAASGADLDSIAPGGNGIRLIRRFAGSVLYEPLPHGNRLTIGFPLSVPLEAESPLSDRAPGSHPRS